MAFIYLFVIVYLFIWKTQLKKKILFLYYDNGNLFYHLSSIILCIIIFNELKFLHFKMCIFTFVIIIIIIIYHVHTSTETCIIQMYFFI